MFIMYSIYDDGKLYIRIPNDTSDPLKDNSIPISEITKVDVLHQVINSFIVELSEYKKAVPDVYKINVNLEELEKAVEYAKEHGPTITLQYNNTGKIGNTVGISKNFDSEITDITNYGCW